MHNLMTDLNPILQRKKRKIETLTQHNDQKKNKIEELKNKQPLKRGRKRKTATKAINNLNKRKNLKKEISENLKK